MRDAGTEKAPRSRSPWCCDEKWAASCHRWRSSGLHRGRGGGSRARLCTVNVVLEYKDSRQGKAKIAALPMERSDAVERGGLPPVALGGVFEHRRPPTPGGHDKGGAHDAREVHSGGRGIRSDAGGLSERAGYPGRGRRLVD